MVAKEFQEDCQTQASKPELPVIRGKGIPEKEKLKEMYIQIQMEGRYKDSGRR